LPLADYSETSTTVVLTDACAVNEKIVVLNMRAVSTAVYYNNISINIVSSTSTSVVYNNEPHTIIIAGDLLAFVDGGTTYTVSSINTSTNTIVFTGVISGATAGLPILQYRPIGEYTPFSRWEIDVSSISSYTPDTFGITNGAEMIFVNGSAFNEIDYDLSGDGIINGFPSTLTGKLIVIQYNNNNLGVPCSNINNTIGYSVASQTSYIFDSNPLSIEIYANGCMLTKGSSYDYTATDANWFLVTAFDNNATLLNQQRFARIGAA
jgi:hypothetical protein